MEEFLDSLGIKPDGQMSDDGCYVIDLTEKQWADYYSILDRSEEVDEDEDASVLTEQNSSIQFLSDDFDITLIDDGENYKLVCREN